VNLGKSGKEENSLLFGDEVQSLDSLGSVFRSLLDRNGGFMEASLSGLIAEDLGFLGVVVVLVSNGELNAVSRSLLGSRGDLGAVKTVLGSACRLVVESSQVHDGRVEAFLSRFGTLWLNLKGTEFSGSSPDNGRWD